MQVGMISWLKCCNHHTFSFSVDFRMLPIFFARENLILCELSITSAVHAGSDMVCDKFVNSGVGKLVDPTISNFIILL